MAGQVLWVVLSGALLACSGRTSLSSEQAAGGRAAAPSAPEAREPLGASERAGQPSEAPGGAAGSSVGGMPGATREASESAGAAGDGGTGSEGGTSSQPGVGGSGEVTVEFPPRAVCGVEVSEYTKRYCPDLATLSLNLEAIEDEGGDGGVSPGEEARAIFSLQNDSSQLFNGGPCLGLLAATPGLTVLESFNPSLQLYGVNAGSRAKMKLRFRVEQGVAPGTRIPLLAWLDVHGALCPNGDELRFELRVAP